MMNERLRKLRVGNVPLLLIHLFKGVCNVESTNFLFVLKLEKFVPTVAGHVHENVGALICQETLGSRDRRLHPTCDTKFNYQNLNSSPKFKQYKPVSTRMKFSTVTS